MTALLEGSRGVCMLTHGCALVFKCIGALIMITFGVERPSERGGNSDSVTEILEHRMLYYIVHKY